MSISPHVSDHYNRAYHPLTYNAFRDRLMVLAASPTYGEPFIDTALNLLTDAALERSGSTFHHGSEQALLQFLQPLDAALIVLVQAHLVHFGAAPVLLTPLDSISADLNTLQHSVEAVAQALSDIPSWRGRTACAWVNAAGYLLHAASAVLVESNYPLYPAEKVDRALDQFQTGALEAKAGGFAFPATFITWIKQRVIARL